MVPADGTIARVAFVAPHPRLFSVPNKVSSDCLLLCSGSSCRKKHSAAFAQLLTAADRAGISADTVKCQGSCAGPTAVVLQGGQYRWFEKLQREKLHADLIDLASGQESRPSKRLAAVELKGKKRDRAARKLGVRL